MIEFLNTHILWWHWVVLGLVLVIAEALDGQLLLFGLGIVSILVGLLKYFIPALPFTVELLIWGFVTLAFFLSWQKIRHKKRLQKLKRIDKQYHKEGIVVEDIDPYSEGKVRFEEPLIGSNEWKAVADKKIPKGAKVKIEKIVGQIVKVKEVAK